MILKKSRILVVDDDNLLLKIFRNSIDDSRFEFVAAISGAVALEIAKEQTEPFDVVVSDMLMPGMDGITFLKIMRQSYPDTVRILLTGSNDVVQISEAINHVDLFRFIPKPINPAKINKTLQDAVNQSRLLLSERDLLQNTLVQSVDALVKILEVTNGTAFATTEHVRNYSVCLGKLLNVPKMWSLEIASLLSQVGCITIPELVLERCFWGDDLSPKEESMMRNHGEIGKSIIVNIPRLEEVADVVALANRSINMKRFDDGDVVAIHASIIRIATMFDMLVRRGREKDEILEILSDEKIPFPSVLIEKLKEIDIVKPKAVTIELHVDKIKNGMYIEEDVKTIKGMLLVSKGYRVNEAVRNRLINFSDEGEIDHIIKVKVSR